jgi:hypothetical protein
MTEDYVNGVKESIRLPLIYHYLFESSHRSFLTMLRKVPVLRQHVDRAMKHKFMEVIYAEY